MLQVVKAAISLVVTNLYRTKVHDGLETLGIVFKNLLIDLHGLVKVSLLLIEVGEFEMDVNVFCLDGGSCLILLNS